MRLRGLTDTRDGRLVVIAVVGGTLMLAAALVNIAMARAADETAADVRAILRHDLAAVSDDELAAYPDSADAIEAVAVEALAGRPARVLGSARPGARGDVVVAVQAGWGWQVRCVEAELRGHATVLTYVSTRPC